MNPGVEDVTPNDDYSIDILFDNGERKAFDMKPYLDKGRSRKPRDPELFKTVRPVMDSVQWKDGQDFSRVLCIWI
uniref:Uncharacterized protein n=1 Tax=Candidatus Kentrum sp. TC TaxID=2126339 RepID=A0A450YQX2_9GAMM|nr:MAG: Protein of unknown function (DUF2442) [Candidatus Kentron sp. TC]